MRLLLLAGLSGAGKSVAIGALEDSGYYCVSNLTPSFLPALQGFLATAGYAKVAVSLDLVSAASPASLPQMIQQLKQPGTEITFLFLDALDEALTKRFSATRRRHPLSVGQKTLAEAIRQEREQLLPIADLGILLDTTDLSANGLRAWIKDFVQLDLSHLTVTLQSFGYKYGVPLDADLVFDVRCLPNPFYEPALAPQTGLDLPVQNYLAAQPMVEAMYQDLERFILHWLPAYVRDNRNYLTIALGCTGGQHRSVYLVERLRQALGDTYPVIIRHRDLSEKHPA